MAFDLRSISGTRRSRPFKVVIGGTDKIGKTSLAASAPHSVGILCEDGANAVDAQAFPLCTTLSDVYSAIGALLNDEHQYQWVFIDSLDWLEPMLHQHVCRANGWKSIEQPGYGKGYIAAADEWRTLLAGLEALRNEKGMSVILIVHDKVKRFESPLHDGYDQYILKLHDRAGSLVLEWADIAGWASYRILTKSADGGGFGHKEVKAFTTGERILHVEPHPAHMGGNRFGLKNMPLEWAAFAAALSTLNKES